MAQAHGDGDFEGGVDPREEGCDVSTSLQALRASTAGNDKALLEARKKIIRNEDARKMAPKLHDTVCELTRHMYEPMPRAGTTAKLDEIGEEQKKRSRKAKQAVLLHAAAMFDVNECNLDWSPTRQNKNDYVNLFCKVVVAGLPGILNGDYDETMQYKSNFMSVHEQMAEHVDKAGRQ